MGKIIELQGLSRFLRNCKRLFVWYKGTDNTSVILNDSCIANNFSLAEGHGTVASGESSHAECYSSQAIGAGSHTEGYNARALGPDSHAEGCGTAASGITSHAEGYNTKATGNTSHAEGFNTTTLGDYSHAEGYGTTASGYCSHAEGYGSQAIGTYSHAEGYGCRAVGDKSHAGGYNSYASGICSFVHGYVLQSGPDAHYQTVFGKYNVSSSTNSSDYVCVVGYGTASARANKAWLTTAGTWSNQSDERAKDDIKDIDENIIKSMDDFTFRQFHLKQDKEINPSGCTTHYGVVAQEVISALTNNGVDYKKTSFIGGDEENKFMVDYNQLLIAKCASYERKIAEMEPIIENYLEKIENHISNK